MHCTCNLQMHGHAGKKEKENDKYASCIQNSNGSNLQHNVSKLCDIPLKKKL